MEAKSLVTTHTWSTSFKSFPFVRYCCNKSNSNWSLKMFKVSCVFFLLKHLRRLEERRRLVFLFFICPFIYAQEISRGGSISVAHVKRRRALSSPSSWVKTNVWLRGNWHCMCERNFHILQAISSRIQCPTTGMLLMILVINLHLSIETLMAFHYYLHGWKGSHSTSLDIWKLLCAERKCLDAHLTSISSTADGNRWIPQYASPFGW